MWTSVSSIICLVILDCFSVKGQQKGCKSDKLYCAPTLQLYWENSHRQYRHEWVYLYSNKAWFTTTTRHKSLWAEEGYSWSLLTGKQLPLQCFRLCVRHISDERGKSQTLDSVFTRKPRETDLKVNIELPSHFLSFSRTVLSRREKHGKATQNSGIRSLHLSPRQVSSILPGDRLLVLPLPWFLHR